MYYVVGQDGHEFSHHRSIERGRCEAHAHARAGYKVFVEHRYYFAHRARAYTMSVEYVAEVEE